MRWIVISLLVVNALILGWRWFATSEPATAPQTQIIRAPAIELLPDGAVSPAQPEESATVQSDADIAPADASSLLTAPSIDALAEAVPESVLTNNAFALPTDPNLTEIGSQVSIAGTGVPANDSPQLGHAGATPDPAQPVVTPSAQASAQCAWTPWQEHPVTALGAAELLQTEQQEQEIGRSYLVYIPAKVSRELTLQRLAELKAEGIEAAYLNKGPQAGGISLGLFSKPESMQLRLRELKKAGIADVSGIERIRTEPRIRQLLRWTGEKTPSPVQNQALVSCNDIAPAAAGQ